MRVEGPVTPATRTLGVEALQYAASKVTPGLAGLAAVFLFIRLLGQEGYGRYGLAWSAANSAAAFFTGWLGQSLLRYYRDCEHLPGVRSALRRGIGLSIGAGVASITLLNVALPGDQAFGWPALASVLLAFTGLSLFQIRTSSLQAQLQAGRVVRLSTLQAALGLGVPLLLLLILARSHTVLLLGLGASYLLSLSLAGGGAWIGTDHTRSDAVGPASRDLLLRFWRYGWPLSFWFVCVSLLPVADRYFIQRYYDFAAVGGYAGLYDVIVRSFSLLLFPIAMAAHPRIMNLWNEGREDEARAMLKWAIVVQIAIFGFVAMGAWALSTPLFALALPELDPSWQRLLLPLLAGGFLWQLALLAHKPLELAHRTGAMLIAAFGALVVHAVGDALLLPRYGVDAAAWMLVVSGAAYVGACWVLSLRPPIR